MPRKPGQTYDWPLIKRLYTEGHTPYAIAKMDGMPTKQAIMYRAKEWKGQREEAQEILPTVNEDQSKAAVIARVLGRLRSGATQKLACAQEGLAVSTWSLWKEDPVIHARAEQAQADYVISMTGKIDLAADTDWKAAAWRLDRHPASRDELRAREVKHEDKGLTVVLNIDRAKATVSDDGKTLTLENHEPDRAVIEQHPKT